VESLSPRGGTGLVVVGRPAVGAAGGVWRLERPVLWGMGPHLIDLLEAALGPVPELRAHGDRSGWVGLHLEHQVGRFSDATLYVTGAEQRSRAIVEAFGPAGSARVDAAEAVGPQAYRTMVEDFAAAVAKGRSSDADVEHGLHLHDLVEAADDDLLRGR
jgi:predicted dehydrogenase